MQPVQQNHSAQNHAQQPQQRHSAQNHAHRPQQSHSAQNQAAKKPRLLPPAGKKKKSRGIMGLLESFLPGAVYNSENRKIFGILSAEDLLLIALIFLFADSGDEDGNLICLALLYVLLSDYIDLSDYF